MALRGETTLQIVSTTQIPSQHPMIHWRRCDASVTFRCCDVQNPLALQGELQQGDLVVGSSIPCKSSWCPKAPKAFVSHTIYGRIAVSMTLEENARIHVSCMHAYLLYLHTFAYTYVHTRFWLRTSSMWKSRGLCNSGRVRGSGVSSMVQQSQSHMVSFAWLVVGRCRLMDWCFLHEEQVIRIPENVVLVCYSKHRQRSVLYNIFW